MHHMGAEDQDSVVELKVPHPELVYKLTHQRHLFEDKGEQAVVAVCQAHVSFFSSHFGLGELDS